MTLTSLKHKNGRPPKTGQLEIQREIRPYFEKNISATLTAEKTGINIKTVCDYFNGWIEKIYKPEESDFFERQRNEKTRIIVSLDNQILDAHNFLDKIDEEIKKLNEQNKPVAHLFSFRLGVMRHILTLTEKKGTFSMQPTMDEALEKEIAEKVRGHDNTRTGS